MALRQQGIQQAQMDWLQKGAPCGTELRLM